MKVSFLFIYLFINDTLFFEGFKKLTGDNETDAQVRDQFNYSQAPSVSLCKQILSLSSHPHVIGQACLTYCDQLSKQLSDPEHENDIDDVISTIQQLLYHGKVCFLQSFDHSAFVELCDVYLSYVDLLRVLVGVKGAAFAMTLADLNEPAKARQLRDNLIKDDRLKLAMDVATKCRIESDPVWAAWGLIKLQQGLYDEAKEKLRHCLVPAEDSRAAQNQRLLVRIVEELEGASALGVSALKDTQMKLAKAYNQLARKTSAEQMAMILSGAAPSEEFSQELEG